MKVDEVELFGQILEVLGSNLGSYIKYSQFFVLFFVHCTLNDVKYFFTSIICNLFVTNLLFDAANLRILTVSLNSK
jgi:hypothetical protein